MINRVIWIVLDSVGMGALPDAEKYGDVGANTIGNVSKALGGLNLPNMEKLGLGNIDGMVGVNKTDRPTGCYGRFAEMSNGKDTTTGHWEMVGIYSEQAFPTYPNGFPKEIIDAFEKAVGRKVIGNKPASGTAIIEELGEEHIKTGSLIVYTSADSVFQIAAHEEVVPLKELYSICEKARNILVGEHAVARVIARPFIGEKGNFTRTPNRRDFSLVPPYNTVLDNLKSNNLNVMAVGKIEDIFSGKGITEAVHTKDNMDGVDKTLDYMKEDKQGLIFTNLVDFDMKWGHRNDVKAYGKGLEDFDARLPEIISAMKDTDILFITADHGCDPTTPGTDHTREYVPFLAYGKPLRQNVNLGTRNSFADMGQTVAEIFNVEKIRYGESFLKEILND
ncbi:phosphopentomutase [Clostridium thermopalmarium]|uniref:Phosphopentomutase n=1 Tax=Clostridium thermopalmarium DSM 5974 TaxID=1121340 RepID=A0A2T0AZB6_9CLOT|nr:phosphopentomutase [Clostridium thermopalmarium]MBE6044310.1 phosphopentomutase [Clostridium thermopalmarium]PRR76559.1 Phosphopentomutase [Clostridium thermopalmarium DSM 5974]PVZ28328.1 phosphopentomutase [Clostridium thermopalmarium DSM 5974]